MLDTNIEEIECPIKILMSAQVCIVHTLLLIHKLQNFLQQFFFYDLDATIFKGQLTITWKKKSGNANAKLPNRV